MSSAASRPPQWSGRSRVFLDEMGIGPLWGLRHGADADALTGIAPAAPAAHVPAAVAGVDAQPSAAADDNPHDNRTVPPAPVVVARPAAGPADSAPSVPSMPSAPARADQPQARPSAPPSAASPDDASANAWFDDAPAPAAVPPVSAEAIAAMDWQQLRAAAAKCTRCDLCRNRKTPVFGRGATQAAWLVLAGAPSRADEKNAQAISGDAGRLLANMMMAAGVAGKPDDAAADRAYVTNLVKCRAVDSAGQDRPPSADEAAACRPFLERELALTGAGTVLAFGQATLKGLLGDGAPARRGAVHRLGSVAVVASYHPEDLLRQNASKAAAWADLCLARDAHAGRE